MASEPPGTSRHTAGRASTVGHRIRVPKMAELVAGDLRRQIVQADLQEGGLLPPEASLMNQYQVSRPTLREAFRILESESLISVRRGARGGARVQLPTNAVAARYAATILQYHGTTLEDVYEARLVVEPPCVALLCRTRTAKTLQRLRRALAEHDAATADPARSVRTHIAFHSLLIELTGNQTLRLLMALLEHIIDMANVSQVETMAGSPAHERASRKGLAAHHRVVEFIENRNPEEAERLWRKHLSEARDYLVRADVRTVLDLMG